MAKEDRGTLVPKLRFPEFQSASVWQSMPLGTAGQFLRGLTYGASDVSDRGLLVLRSTNIQEGRLILDKDLVFVAKECPDELALQPGDVAICMSNGSKALVGKSAEYMGGYSGRLTVGAFCSIFRATVPFAKFAFSTDGYSDFVALAIGGGNINNLKNSALEAFEFAVPEEPAEQRKITDCLTALDQAIAAQGRKVVALKAYKRGLMQQLFPREGETIPRLRFPEFRNGPAWQEAKAQTLFANRIEKGDDSLPIYSVTMTDGLVKRSSLDRRIDDLADATGNKKARQHDIAYNMMRMWQGACGVASEDCMVSPAYVVLSPNSGVHSPFYGYLFKLPQMLRQFASHSRGLTEDRLRLYYQDFSSISLPLPGVREQVQIASCLLALDARITDESEKMSALMDHKRGLMSQLFPSAEEA